MSNKLDQGSESTGLSLSALMDGQATAADAEALCARWRGDETVRERWLTYHLIGDVLRSEDLATRSARDEAFLAALSARLAQEPLPLAPKALAPRRQLLSWPVASAAVAAGFVVVAGLMVVLRPASDGASGTLAARSKPDLNLASGQLVRDAELDRYLAAHRRVSNGASVGMPGAVVRGFETIAVEDK